MWPDDQMLKHKEEMTIRDTEVVLLKGQLLALEGDCSSVSSSAGTSLTDDIQLAEWGSRSQIRRGKAPPVQPFTGDKADQLWDDWLSTLERAGTWYG